jgi:hypothetical protein
MYVTHRQTIAAENAGASGRTAAGNRNQPDFQKAFQRETGATDATRDSAPMLPPPPHLPVSYTPAAIESRMNQWLMAQITRQNQMRMEIYDRAVENWKLNSARHRELGLPQPPPPAPPVLEPVEPMPDGWWFQTHDA